MVQKKIEMVHLIIFFGNNKIYYGTEKKFFLVHKNLNGTPMIFYGT